MNEKRETTVSIIGAGKMGLPIACHIARRGARVFACDINRKIVDAINSGQSPIDEPGVAELIKTLVRDKRLVATTQTVDAVAQSQVVIVLVPVLLTPDRHADLTLMRDALRVVFKAIKPGALVIIETTLPVGAARELFGELGGGTPGRDYFAAFSPERVKSMRVLEKLGETPKIVGGYTSECAQKALDFYQEFLGAPVMNVGSLEAAEYTKLTDMIYRDVNIALANELARYSELLSIDFETVRRAANTSGEANILLPGIGVGGHCTPIYPYFAIHDAARRNQPLQFAKLAREMNDGQASHALNRLEAAWEKLSGKNVLILGLGFRPQVKEHVCSPAIILRDELLARGANVRLHDPLYTEEEIRVLGFEPHSSVESSPADALVLNTGHQEYGELDFNNLKDNGLKAVLDGRNFWNRQLVENAQVIYVGIGC